MGWVFSFMILHLLFLWSSSSSSAATSRSIVKSLPGFDGNLPFKLETGYVGVGETEDVQLFYYFVQSQSDPSTDPLLAWLNGGPDAPVGTGFSYSRSSQGYYSDDQKAAEDLYEFLQKFGIIPCRWLIDHPNFAKNQLYVGGGSYSGIPVPVTVQKIYEGNKVGRMPFMNIKGYVLGSPKTDSYLDANTRVPAAHRVTLISDELYKSAKTSCNSDYVNIDPRNVQCVTDIAAINELLGGIFLPQVLLPDCTTGSKKPNTNYTDGYQRIFMKTSKNLPQELWCRDHIYLVVGIWANDPIVREALHVREGTKGYWQICNSSLAYTKNIPSTIDYHRNLSKTNLRALIYTADQDIYIPFISAQEWIRSLNLTLDESWRAWFVDAQVAGYTVKYTNNDFYMTYSSVKGAGHVPEEFKPKQVYAMIERWLSYYPL